ncbi:hypothetical protein [Pelagibacterium sp.]|uniref:hypothetical protein n=1 Tax=Pelagibacterium sp. TaxID=1967288 RepID=UPI003A92F503
MAAKSDYISGTISLTNGETVFTGTGTGWALADFREGDTIIDITGATEFMGVIATIDANGAGTLTKAWEGPTLVDVAYRMRYQPDGSRVSAQARNLIELLGNGNLQAVAGLEGSANQVLMFTGPGAMTIVPKTELISGAAYDVQVDDLTARSAYDGQDTGYAVLVADTGDGRSAIYSKNSTTSADWSDPAYVTGPIGETPDVTVGDVTTGDPGTPAAVTATPTVGGVELDFTIPAGEGFSSKGDYSGAVDYVTGDVTQDQGSSWIARQPTTGNAPPALPTTSNAYWQLLARAGNDGAGTVTSLAGGTGISVDSTDPTVPVVSAVIASQVEAEAGTEAAKLMTPERTAQAIAALANPWATMPIGVPFPIYPGAAEPPTDQAFRYIKLTASDAYNVAVLVSESISGSAPVIEATAVVDLDGSPFDGESVRLINTERRFIRPGSAGTLENGELAAHNHDLLIDNNAGSIGANSGAGRLRAASSNLGRIAEPSSPSTNTSSIDSSGGSETRPRNIGFDYYIRIL